MKKCILNKKNISLAWIFFHLAFPLAVSAQVTFYKETIGSASGVVNASSYGGWIATNATNVTAAGSVLINNGIIPSNYAGASGGTPISVLGNSSLVISGINTTNFANIKLSFGIHKANKLESGSDLKVQVSTDGVTYSNLSMALLPTGNGSGNSWFYRSGGTDITGNIPRTANLRIKLTTTAATPYDFDDIELKGDVPLPLHLLDFQAQRTNNVTEISWNTEDEVNVDHFEIQRSENGSSFKTIIIAQAKNNITRQVYSATDILPIENKAYYRLYSVDKDGKSTYSSIISVNSGAIESFSISMNSDTKDLIINQNASHSQVYQYSIVNMNGMLIQKGQLTLSSGINKIALRSGINRGIYVVQVISGNISKQLKTDIH